MNQESMQASAELLDMLMQLLDESTPQELLPRIAKVACQVLHADSAVLEIPAELADEPFRFAYPASVAISSSAVRRARESWFLADSTKFARVYPAVITELRGGAILTDRCPSPQYTKQTLVKEAEL